MIMKKVHVTSLGCPKNFVDSEVMLGLLEADGWTIVSEVEEALVLLVNTCGFIQPAVEEGIGEILELAKYKEKDPAKKLIVTGCMVQRYKDKLQKELPEIDMLLGTEAVKDIAQCLRSLLDEEDGPLIYLPKRFLMDATMPRKIATPFFRAWVKITEGCDNRCSYCMIPSIRGPLRSRSVGDLVEECKRLEEGGVREISLIAQDLTAYGTDDKKDVSKLQDLLLALLGQTNIPWIRLLYLYPTSGLDDLIQLMADNSRIVPYLDIPFQHVSDHVLRRMNRRYCAEDLINIITTARRYLPEIALRSTFLLGFPGETQADVDAVAEFLQSMQIDHVGVFPYANEEGCPSEGFDNQVDEQEKQERVEYILQTQAAVSANIQKKYIGSRQTVLVEGVSRETDLLLEGRTRFQAAEIDGCVYINDGQANPGEFVTVEVHEAQTYDLVGAIV